MKRRRHVVGFTLITACLFGAGLPIGAAVAGSAYSGWDRFADYGSGASRHCAGQQASVHTPPAVINAYGHVRHRSGADCNDVSNVASGWLGVSELLERADGTLCASRGYSYNSGAASEIAVPTNQGQGACSSWSSLRAWAFGRFYRASISGYIDAPAAIISPFQN